MGDDTRTVHCDTHGPQQETFVCYHVVSSLRTGNLVGFFWAHDPENPRPDAWCSACNDLVGKDGGDWNEQSENFANIQLLCGKCYDRARELNFPEWRQYFN